MKEEEGGKEEGGRREGGRGKRKGRRSILGAIVGFAFLVVINVPPCVVAFRIWAQGCSPKHL
jgi:hypothetical protein